MQFSGVSILPGSEWSKACWLENKAYFDHLKGIVYALNIFNEWFSWLLPFRTQLLPKDAYFVQNFKPEEKWKRLLLN